MARSLYPSATSDLGGHVHGQFRSALLVLGAFDADEALVLLKVIFSFFGLTKSAFRIF